MAPQRSKHTHILESFYHFYHFLSAREGLAAFALCLAVEQNDTELGKLLL